MRLVCKLSPSVAIEDGLAYISNGKFGFYWDQVNSGVCKFRCTFISSKRQFGC